MTMVYNQNKMMDNQIKMIDNQEQQLNWQKRMFILQGCKNGGNMIGNNVNCWQWLSNPNRIDSNYETYR